MPPSARRGEQIIGTLREVLGTRAVYLGDRHVNMHLALNARYPASCFNRKCLSIQLFEKCVVRSWNLLPERDAPFPPSLSRRWLLETESADYFNGSASSMSITGISSLT